MLKWYVVNFKKNIIDPVKYFCFFNYSTQWKINYCFNVVSYWVDSLLLINKLNIYRIKVIVFYFCGQMWFRYERDVIPLRSSNSTHKISFKGKIYNLIGKCRKFSCACNKMDSLHEDSLYGQKYYETLIKVETHVPRVWFRYAVLNPNFKKS